MTELSSSSSSSSPSASSSTSSASSATPSAARIVLRLAIAVVVGALGFGAFAVAYPADVPESIGLMVENLTGANPHPVVLQRPPVAPLSAMAQLGKQLFYDKSLSASGQQSCASCHSPEHSYGPPTCRQAVSP
jgi:cytochrome c peroxidase